MVSGSLEDLAAATFICLGGTGYEVRSLLTALNQESRDADRELSARPRTGSL